MSRVPPPAAELIRRHSQARVIHASQKPMVARYATLPDGKQVPVMAKPMSRTDVINQMVRQYG